MSVKNRLTGGDCFGEYCLECKIASFGVLPVLRVTKCCGKDRIPVATDGEAALLSCYSKKHYQNIRDFYSGDRRSGAA